MLQGKGKAWLGHGGLIHDELLQKNLRAALEQFEAIGEDLSGKKVPDTFWLVSE